MIDQQREGGPRSLIHRRWDSADWIVTQGGANGVVIQAANVRLRLRDNRVVCFDATTDEEMLHYRELRQDRDELRESKTELQQAKSKLEESNTELQQAKSKLEESNTELQQALEASERVARDQARAREDAERVAHDQVRAREDAERRLRDLEAELRRLRGEPPA